MGVAVEDVIEVVEVSMDGLSNFVESFVEEAHVSLEVPGGYMEVLEFGEYEIVEAFAIRPAVIDLLGEGVFHRGCVRFQMLDARIEVRCPFG